MEQNTTIINCKRHFRHPVTKVFGAFLDPGKVKQWFGPKEFSIGDVQITPTVNGDVAIEMISPRGDVLWVRGRYTSILPDSKIEYTFVYEPDMPGLGETLVTIHFTADTNGTEVSLIHTIYKPINAQGRAKGWEDGFDKMEQLLSTQ